MEFIKSDETNNIIVYISSPILFDYLFTYCSESIQKEVFSMINSLRKNLKYKLSVEDKREFIKTEIENNLKSNHLDLFKRLKFSIDNTEFHIDRNWLFDVLEDYPNEGINWTFVYEPKLLYGETYTYTAIETEEHLMEDFKYEKPNFIKEVSEFIYADYLIENENNILNANLIKNNVIEELNPNQIQKIGLLKRSGIIDFLRENNKLTNNQIARFIDILTKEHLKQASVTSHLIDDVSNKKHPFYINGSVGNIDLILSKCGIKPHSEK
ncbi:hypothetical protein [Elizabethkingia anophelis]|uniref:hypothetical protein n=1 Tax=Elizabethkingia anophelis TaxID=1117645 RepID=UPI0032078EAC